MLHPIGVYRNCPSNNIFIASGWLDATLGNHPRDPTIVSAPPSSRSPSRSPGNPLSSASRSALSPSVRPHSPPLTPLPPSPSRPPRNAQSIRTQIDCRIIIENTRAAGSRRFFFSLPPPFCPLPRGHTINSLSFADMPLEISLCYLELFTRHCPIRSRVSA